MVFSVSLSYCSRRIWKHIASTTEVRETVCFSPAGQWRTSTASMVFSFSEQILIRGEKKDNS